MKKIILNFDAFQFKNQIHRKKGKISKILKLYLFQTFKNNICPNERHEFWQLRGHMDHKSCLGPN